LPVSGASVNFEKTASVEEHATSENIMFNSTVLEVGVGVLFSFLAVSLITGAIVEAISSATKWRASNLLSGVKTLLNDPDFTALARDLYAHAAVNPHGPGADAPTENKPAYIDKNQFADALMDITGMSAAISAAAGAGPPETQAAPLVTALKTAVDAKIAPAAAEPPAAAVPDNPQIRQLLHGIIDRSMGEAAKIKEALGNWFENGMDRLSGTYKRRTQLVSMIIALILAVGLNVDSISIGKALWEQPTLVANLKVTDTDTAPSAEEALKLLNETLPIGWPHGIFVTNRVKKDRAGSPMKNEAGNPVYSRFEPWDWLASGCGWLLTTIATLFGAPFWFDALQKITRLKGSGPSPDDKKNQVAAPS
jgi:hypothetical protein